MSVTIDSLDIQIRSSAGSAKQNIEGLAKALEQLNGQAKVTKIVNALDKLNVSLTNLRSNAGVMGQLSSLSKSLAGLASIPKLTGLQSAITQLKKLPEVMQSLNSANMAQFTLKLKQLSAALTPLATQLEKIGTAFSKLPTRITQVVTATNRMNRAVRESSSALNHQSLNLMTATQNLQTYLSVIHFVGDAVSRVMSDAIEWDGIQFRFGRAFGEDAEEVYAYAQKVSDVLKINIQQFMQYSSLYGSLLKGFGMAQEKVTAISVGLTELSYDIWAAYNDRFKTLEDASEAIRSAITGEIEPIRNAGIALTEASLQEYIDSTHLAGISIEKLTEAQKAEVRYAAMVNAAMDQGIIGTYAREMQTAEGAVRTLSQQLKTLGQALGSLFIPALQVAVPWLSAFVELLTEGLIALGAMFGIKFQEITWDKSASGLGNMAENAGATGDALSDATKEAKKLKSYTMGFDELNVINPTSGSGSGSGSGEDNGWGSGLDLETLWDDAVFKSASKQVDELKEKIKNFYEDWKWQIEGIGAGLAALGLGKLVSRLKDAEFFSGGFLKNMNTVSKLGVSAITISIQWMLMDEFLGNFIEEGSWAELIKAAAVAALGTWALSAMWGPTGVVIGLSITAAVSLKAMFEDGSVDSIEEVVAGITGIGSAVAATAFVLKNTDLGTAIKMLFDGNKFSDVFAAMFPKMSDVISTVTEWVTKTLVPGFSNVLAKLPSLLSGVAKALPWVLLIAAIVGAIALAITDKDFTDIGYKVGHAIGNALKSIGEWLGNVGEWIAEVGKGILKGIESAWTWVKETFDIDNVFELIYLMFNPKAWITEIIPKMIEIGAEVLPGLWKGIKDGWNNFWGNIKEFIDGFIQGFKDGLGIASPSKVFAEIGEFILEGLLNGISDGWDKLKNWWKTSVAPKFTLSYWKEKFDVIREAISSKLNEVKQTASDKWTAIKTWFSSNVASKFTLDYWKSKFDVIRSAVATKIAEVKEAASMQWDKIKTWFASNIAPKFTLSFWLDKFKNLKEGFTQTIKNAVNAGIDLLNRFINWINDNLNFSWDPVKIAGKEILPGGSVQLFTIPNIPRFEKGGFIEDGLFTMNYGEIAGKFSNGKSVVANNQQIVDGIAAGVYEAVVAAMNASNGRQDQNVNVYLDGKQIYASVKKRDSERGRQLMGNQLGYSY